MNQSVKVARDQVPLLPITGDDHGEVSIFIGVPSTPRVVSFPEDSETSMQSIDARSIDSLVEFAAKAICFIIVAGLMIWWWVWASKNIHIDPNHVHVRV